MRRWHGTSLCFWTTHHSAAWYFWSLNYPWNLKNFCFQCSRELVQLWACQEDSGAFCEGWTSRPSYFCSWLSQQASSLFIFMARKSHTFWDRYGNLLQNPSMKSLTITMRMSQWKLYAVFTVGEFANHLGASLMLFCLAMKLTFLLFVGKNCIHMWHTM